MNGGAGHQIRADGDGFGTITIVTAMVKLRYRCDCKTCPGWDRSKSEEIIYGGWVCMCSCHDKPKKTTQSRRKKKL